MRESIWHIVMILVIGGLVFFTNLGGSRLWDRDEPRNAGCAAEMMARGDWVVPIFNDELRHQKPVLLYWLVMSAYSVLGISEFSARFWSAALALGTVLATYGIASRLANRSVAWLAAIALATSLMFDVAARAVTPDSVLIFCSTSSILIYVLGTFRAQEEGAQLKVQGQWFPKNMGVVAGFYFALGLGVLAKGPVGFVIPMAIIGLFMLVQTLPERTWVAVKKPGIAQRIGSLGFEFVRPFHPFHFLKTLGAMRPAWGAVIVLVVALPWYAMVHVRTGGDFTRLFFVGEHFGRATTTLESHSGGFWFYPLAILIGFFPWSVFWGPVVVGLIREGKRKRFPIATCLMLCWVGVQVVTFSLAQTKLPSYVTPCYPALALLTAICLQGLATRKSSVPMVWFYLALGGLMVAGLGISAGVGWATLEFMPGQFWLAGLGVFPIVSGGVMIYLLYKKRHSYIPIAMAGSALVFCFTLFSFGAASVDREQKNDRILDRIAQLPEAEVASFGCLESSWVYYGKHSIRELDRDAESESALPDVRQNFWSPKSKISVEDFVSRHPQPMILTSGKDLAILKKRLGPEFFVVQDVEYFLKNKRLFLLARRTSFDGDPESPESADLPSKQ